MKGKIIQIQVCPVQNNQGTQCDAYMWALTDEGYLYFKKDNDREWYPESIKVVD